MKKIERLYGLIDEALRLQSSIDNSIGSLVVSLHLELSKQRIVEIASLMDLDEDRCQISPSGQYPQVGIRGFGGGLFPKPKLSGLDTSYKYFNRIKTGQVVLSQVKA